VDASLPGRWDKGNNLFWGLALAGLLLLVGLAAWFVIDRGKRLKAIPEEDWQQPQEVLQGAHQPLDEKEVVAEVKPVFDSLGAALRERDHQRILSHFDLGRLGDEMIALNVFPGRDRVDRNFVAQGLWSGMNSALIQLAPQLEWTEVEFHGVQTLADNEVILFVRHRSKEGAFRTMRWWLTRRAGRWKVYDLLDLDVGLQLKTALAPLADFSVAGIGWDEDLFGALVQVWAGRDDRAVLLFKSALAKQMNAHKRKEYVKAFLAAMAKAGKAVPAYAAAPDATEAFRVLAAELKKGQRTDELRRLVRTHGKKVPRDPLLPFYQAEMHVEDENYALADKTFQAGLAIPPDAATLAEFRASRVAARYHTGHMLSAYAEIGPRQETFEQLADLCLEEEDLSRLQTLLDAHAKASPQDPESVWYRCRLKARGKQVAEAAALLRQALAQQSEEKQTERVATFLSDVLAAGKMLEGYRAAPDARKAFRHLAGELEEEDRPEELRRLVEAHQQAHPDDPWGAYYQGQFLLEEKAWDRAVQILGEAWRKATEEERPFFRWRYVLALSRAGRSQQAYAEIEPSKDTYNQLANLLIGDEKWQELEDLIKVRFLHAAEDPDLLFHKARARVGLKRPAEAIPLLLEAYQQQTAEPQKSSYVATFVLDMERHSQGLEGYRAVPDKRSAFRSLANKLLADKKEKELDKLLQEHGGKHADDLWYSYYLGELLLLRREPRKAEQQFAAALAKAGPQEVWMVRSALSRARVKAGHAVEAYLEARPETRPFDELAGLCLVQQDVGQLEALLKAHRRDDPDDPGLTVWELEVRWLRRDYQGALKWLAEHREGVFAQARHRWKYQDYLVRALVRLNRPQEAVKEAEGFLKKKYANPVLLVLAYAAQGDLKRAIAGAERLRGHAYRLTEFYRDTDLGPLLRRASFQEFRTKFPEPKEKE
jgi:hypothetical protein